MWLCPVCLIRASGDLDARWNWRFNCCSSEVVAAAPRCWYGGDRCLYVLGWEIVLMRVLVFSTAAFLVAVTWMPRGAPAQRPSTDQGELLFHAELVEDPMKRAGPGLLTGCAIQNAPRVRAAAMDHPLAGAPGHLSTNLHDGRVRRPALRQRERNLLGRAIDGDGRRRRSQLAADNAEGETKAQGPLGESLHATNRADSSVLLW